MKKIILLFAVLVVAFSSCSKDDDDNSFKYDINTLVGKWRITNVQLEDGWLDVTTAMGESVFDPTYATFNSDGTYIGKGEFGNGSGTYKAENSTIICYVEKQEYARYEVISLTGTECQLKMIADGESLNIKCKKEKED